MLRSCEWSREGPRIKCLLCLVVRKWPVRKRLPLRPCEGKPLPPCPHLGEPTGQKAEVICICCGGQHKSREYEIFECGLFGECLPKYECTRESKDATAEWMERNGREVALTVCRGCPRKLEMPLVD